MIHLTELHPGAIVLVDCQKPTCPVADRCCTPYHPCICDDVVEATVVIVDQMDGADPDHGLVGAALHHRGVFGPDLLGSWETLTIGAMCNGALVDCAAVAGILNLTKGIGQGAVVKLGSVGYPNPLQPQSPALGIVDLMGRDSEGHATGPQNVAGTLQVDGGIAGQIINGGNVTATGQVKLVKNDGTFAGQATFANVSGSMRFGNPDVNPPSIANVSGTLDVADVSGTVVVTGNVASSGSVHAADVSGTISVGGSVVSGGSVEVAGVTSGGSLQVADVSGTVRVAGSVTSGGTILLDDVTSSGSVNVGGSLVGGLTVGGALAGSVDVSSDMSGYLTAEGGNTSGSIHIGGDQFGPVTVKGSLDSGGTMTVDGHLKGTAIINVTGLHSGSITVKKGTASATKIQAQGGLSSGSSIYANACGGSTETVQGTIWLGGATNQNTTLTMDGSVQINCSGGTMTSTGKVKLVGCPAYDGKQADICLNGTPYYGHVTQTLTCFQGNNEVPDTFHLLCVPLSSCPSCP